MKEKRKGRFTDVTMKLAPLFFSVAIAFCVLFLLIGEMIAPSERDYQDNHYGVFETQWYQITALGEREEVTMPGKVDAEWGETTTIVTILPDTIVKGENICFRLIWQDAKVYIDDELRAVYDTKDTRPFGKNSAFRYFFVRLTEADRGKELRLEFTSDSKYAGSIKDIYYGEKTSIWTNIIEGAISTSAAALCLGLMGFFCILVCAVLRFAFKKALGLRYLAWAIFLCAWWMISEMEFRQLLVKNVSIWANTTYWSLMLIAFPILLYVDEIQEHKYRKWFSISLAYSGIVFVLGTIAQVFNIIEFVTQLPFIHAGLIFSIVLVIGTLTIDTISGRIKNYMLVGIGIYGMLLSAVFEMIFYYLQVDLSLGTVLAVGLMFLLVMAIIKTARDILDDEKKKQEAIVAREAQAKFLASMSHEIRTPINAVIGMNEMIMRTCQAEEVQEYAQNIQRASSMLLELVNDVLDFSKIESGQLEIVEGAYYLGNIIQDEQVLLNTRIADKPIDVKMELDPQIPSKLYGDELRIKQIATNLLSNAAKYTKKGTITIKIGFEWLEEDTIMLRFSISDTGNGIKEEELPRLFDEFKRLDVDKNYNIEGTGLGLNIVKRLVSLMQGQIEVESTYGKGSTFTVQLPQKVVDKRPIGDYQELIKRGKNNLRSSQTYFVAPKAQILVVDDNAMNLTLMSELLKRTQMKVDLARSGMECIRFSQQKKYDLILMDHMMPGMDGIETLHKIRIAEKNPNCDTTIIALTANAIAGCREMYLEYGFNDYFSKPIQADKLEKLLIHYLPKEFVSIVEKEIRDEKRAEMTTEPVAENMESLLEIDREAGLSYCMDMEEIYRTMLEEFCGQVEESLPQLDKYFEEENWKDYAVTVHALKTNARTIGAINFANLTLKHEKAAKEEDVVFLKAEYKEYASTLQELVNRIRR